jgi:glycosyltransferase involved in cell wall biosynthesis
MGPPADLRVLSVIHSAAFGGPHNQAVQLHRVADQQGGMRLTVVLPEEPGDAPERLRAAGVPVVQMPLLRPRASFARQNPVQLVFAYPRQIRSLIRLIESLEIDVVEVHGLLNFDGAVAARLARRGLVWQLIDTRPPMSLRVALMPFILMLADVIMVTGERLASEYPGARLRPRRLSVFVPPVDPPARYREPSDDIRRMARRRLGVSADALLAVAVGNLNPQKGYETLIDAVGICRQAGTEIELRVRGAIQQGHAAYAEGLNERAEERGLSVDAVGPLERDLTPFDVMVAADMLVLPSRPRSEGLPTVVLESMACGVPVVATEVGAVREIVRDGISGMLVHPDRVGELTEAISYLATHPEERHRLGHAGRDVAETLASPEIFSRTQLAAYRMACSVRTRRAVRS